MPHRMYVVQHLQRLLAVVLLQQYINDVLGPLLQILFLHHTPALALVMIL